MTDLDTTYLGLEPALADRRLGRAAHRRPRHGGPPRRRRRRRDRAAVAVRGGDRPRGDRAELRAGSRLRSLRRGTQLLPRRASDSRAGGIATSPRSEQVKARVPVPVIASLNATSPGGWTRYARLLGDAGADALELNLYRVAADPAWTAAEMEDDDLELISEVAPPIDVPVAVKLSPLLLGDGQLRHPRRRRGG